MIPRVVYQTWRNRDEASWAPHERRWVHSWRARSGRRHELHDDADCAELVRRSFPEQLDTYRSLRPVEKADLWRCLVLFERGGVYADFDTICRGDLDAWLRPRDEIVLGLMTDHAEKYPEWRARRALRSGGGFDPTCPWRDHPVLFTNWTMASCAGHPLLADVIRRIGINARDPYFLVEDPAWTVKKTGPGVLTDALNDHFARCGTSGGEVARRLRRERELCVGGIRLLDYAAFHSRYVVHLGMRSWSVRRRGVDWLVNRARIAIL